MKPNTYHCKYFSLSKYKGIEFQLSRWEDSPMFDFTIWIRRKGKTDHHGVEVCLTLFHHEFRVDFYDGRHVEDITGEKPKIEYGDVDLL